MVFIIDRVNFRTYDPDRGYELFLVGGGSDGTERFRLVGPVSECNFSAHTFEEKLRPDELARLGPNYDKTPVVWCIHHWTNDWKSIVREAMTAFLINHGSPIPNLEAFVRFGTKESVFDV
jgi:hypothetical protein